MQPQSTAAQPLANAQLFSPFQLGALPLAHRVVMAPLTRMRTSPGDVPNDLMADYYAQRATAGGFIVAEATLVAPNGQGYLGAPGIFTDAQTEGWKKITRAVHAKGGYIYLQLWHAGRQSHCDLQPDGGQPIGPSALETQDLLAFTEQGWTPVTPNRALETAEIPALVEAFRTGAERAKAAGFDGVELHGANGYLIDQFLQDGANHRTDAYGGTIANRTRFLLEVVGAMVSVWGGDRVSVRLGPSGTWGGMSDSDPIALFSYAVEQLNQFDLAYLHLIEPRIYGSVLKAEGLPPVAAEHLRPLFRGPLLAAGGFDQAGAEAILDKGDADLVAFGRQFIANPDLVERFRRGLPLNAYDRDSFFGGDAHGYVDYPFYTEATALANEGTL